MTNTLNAALDRGPDIRGLTATQKNTLLGEAHFLRALEYFTLVQQFGDVTLSLHEKSRVVLEATRQAVADVYKAILRRSRISLSHRPTTAAATKGAALTLRSKV